MFPNTYGIAKGRTTRPADTIAYASGDLVANNTTAGSVVAIPLDASSGPGRSSIIKRVSVAKSGVGVTNASFRVHLFTAAPTVANGDNGAFSAAGAASYLGSIDVTVGQAFTDGAFGAAAADISFLGQALYALIEARGAYTPVSGEIFTVGVEVAQG